MQKVQLLHLTEPTRELVSPSEVVISQGEPVLLAQPIVSPIEQLRRKDKEVARALEEKQKLIEEILNIPHEELESIAEHGGGGAASPPPRTAAEILLSALSQARSLTSLVNKTLKISEEEAARAMALRSAGRVGEAEGGAGGGADQQRTLAKGERLIEITTGINRQLTTLLAIIQEGEKERAVLRRQVGRAQEQVRCLVAGECASYHSIVPSPASTSTPLSPVTPASSGSPLPSPPLSTPDPADRHSTLSSLSR